MPDFFGALLKLDRELFHIVNGSLYSPLLARGSAFLANDIFLGAIGAAGFFWLVLRGGARHSASAFYALSAAVAANILNSQLLKPLFKRARPVETLEGVNFLLEKRSYGYAFPSTHTAMAAALLVVLWFAWPKARVPAAVIFLCVAFFCVYTGGHYPADVAAGALFGTALGAVMEKLRRTAVETGN